MTDSPKKKKRTRRSRRGLAKLDKFMSEPARSGLDPADMLTSLSAEQRKLVTWLARHKDATVAGLSAGISKPVAATEALLHELLSRDFVRETLRDGRRSYRVAFGGRSGGKLGDVLHKVWTSIGTERVEFLRKLPIFAGFEDAEIEALAMQMQMRRYERDDVILWQGQVVRHVYFIKSGVASISILQDDDEQKSKYVDYAKEGDVLGEYSLLAERDQTASATVTALSTVEVLIMPHEQVKQVLFRYPSASFGVAQMLVRRLMDKLYDNDAESHVVLVFGSARQRLIVGSMLASVMARDQRTVLTMFPDSQALCSAYDLDEDRQERSGTMVRTVPLGHDIALLDPEQNLPLSVQMTLAMKKFGNDYAACVIGLPLDLSSALNYAIEQAVQLVIVSEPEERAWAEAQEFVRAIRPMASPERTLVSTALLGSRDDAGGFEPTGRAPDFNVPVEPAMEILRASDFADAPAALVQAVEQLAGRLGRTHQVCVYIPTTMDVDRPIDTTPYLERTLAFFGELFGGATSAKAQGVWSSEDAGLVGETVYIVRTYTSPIGLKNNLPRILSYVQTLKETLQQEAMAVEVNQKLMLL